MPQQLFREELAALRGVSAGREPVDGASATLRRLCARRYQPPDTTPVVVGLTRRADPERIHHARRIAVRNGLTDYGMPLEEAERWCTAWEAEAATRDVSRDDRDYWTVGSAWIAEQRKMRRKA